MRFSLKLTSIERKKNSPRDEKGLEGRFQHFDNEPGQT
jgi:hypothetical protein